MDRIEYEAHLQTDDFTGTVAVDNADFEHFHGILGLPDDELIIGLNLGATHPSLGIEGKNRADGSYSHLEVLTIARRAIPDGGLPVLFADTATVEVIRTRFDMPDSTYPSDGPIDAFALLQRAAKRLSIVLWIDSLVEAGLDAPTLQVVGERLRAISGGHWVDVPD